MKGGHGICRQQFFNGVGNLEAQNAGVRQAGALDLSTSAADATDETFDAQKILVRIFGRDIGEKGAITAAKIDFERRVPAIDRVELQRRKTIRRDELSFARYSDGRIGGNVR